MTRGGVQVPEEDAWVRASKRLRPQWQSLEAGRLGISIPVSISQVNQFDNARYRNLNERDLKVRLVYDSPNMNRDVSFEYMNRPLVWNEFSEMLLLLLPLLNSSTLRNLLRPFSKDKDKYFTADDSVCPVCQNNPSIPFLTIPCQHRYCYYCFRTRCAAAPSFRCLRCNEPVVAIQQHSESIGDIISKT